MHEEDYGNTIATREGGGPVLLEAIENDRLTAANRDVRAGSGSEVPVFELAKDKHDRGTPVVAVLVALGYRVHVDLHRCALEVGHILAEDRVEPDSNFLPSNGVAAKSCCTCIVGES